MPPIDSKTFWRTLDEALDHEAFAALLQREFPEHAMVWPETFDRRRFLALMGASLALAGLNGCSVRPAPNVRMAPYVQPPEEIVPGRPLFFATTMVHDGGGIGVLVESHMGRPIKIEGNPNHPASLGATTLWNQASILTLYDPDRSPAVTFNARPRAWTDAEAMLRKAMEQERPRRGAKMRLLTESVVSPTLRQQIEGLLNAYPDVKWHVYEPVSRDAVYEGTRMAFGESLNPIHDFRRADVVLSLDDDFLFQGPASLRYASEFMARRRVRTNVEEASRAEMNRLYMIETAVSCTGAKADHRLAVPASEVKTLALAVAAELGLPDAAGGGSAYSKWVAAVAKDFVAHRGRSLVVAGTQQPAVVHLLAHAMNERLGNIGETVTYTEPVEAQPVDRTESLRELVDAMEQGEVEFLLILDANPAYTAPADIPFATAMQKVPLRVHVGLYQDETARLCQWHLPETHYLEAWGDALAYDGTASLIQPLVEPLYAGRSLIEIMTLLGGERLVSGQEVVRSYWQKRWEEQGGAGDFDRSWQTWLHDGVIPDTAFRSKSVHLAEGWQKHLKPAEKAEKTPSMGSGLEIVFQPDPTIYDGRFGNNGWLQECPKPVAKLTWGNAALISPATAARLGLVPAGYAPGGEHGGYLMPVVELHVGTRSMRGPVWIMPGHADEAITVSLGYGRERLGRAGFGLERTLGSNAYLLRTSDRPWFARGLRVDLTEDTEPVACTQSHHLMENRELVRAATLAEYHEHPQFALEREKEVHKETTLRAQPPISLYEPFTYEPPQPRWGMVIDTTTCIGCQACVVACQAENNIPIVGKEQVLAGREMHWLRVDRYVQGAVESPEAFYFQPLPCMHCEEAPCEYVCPTAATVHSADGLNDMIYNRCVGTRFCSNNCPYKVRRFNFFHYADYTTQPRRLQYNPDVTVRSRGVMEKCTYCVQRIRRAEIDSRAEGRSIVDGEILTACQAACPTEAILFGDLNDPKSRIRRWAESPLNYSLLGELNTQPRTTYLAALRNPNPLLETE